MSHPARGPDLPLEPFATFELSTSGGEARVALAQQAVRFALVVDGDLPIALLSAEQLASLLPEDAEFSSALERLPPLLLIEALPGDLEEVEQVVGLLAQTGAAGVAVEQDGVVVGAVSAEALATALPLDRITGFSPSRGWSTMAGPRTYVCRQCRPERRRRPRDASSVPVCEFFSHGRMEPES